MSKCLSIQKLNNTNYNIWAVLMDAVLVQKHVKYVVDYSSIIPSTGPNSTAGKAWIRKNNEACAAMILSIESD
jgi:hypothetical protein